MPIAANVRRWSESMHISDRRLEADIHAIVPFLFSTGYGGPPLEEEFRYAPAIGKPFSIDQLKEQLQIILALP
jgi:hypothetical protein